MDIGAWAEMDGVKIWNQLGQIWRSYRQKQGLTGSEIHSSSPPLEAFGVTTNGTEAYRGQQRSRG